MTTAGDICPMPMCFRKYRSMLTLIACSMRSVEDFQRSTDCSFSVLRGEVATHSLASHLGG